MRCIVAVAAISFAAAQPRDLSSFNFGDYLAQHEKSYAVEEHAVRKEIFEKNLAIVKNHNEQYRAGQQSWWMEMNAFADWKPEEFKRLLSKRRDLPRLQAPTVMPIKTQANPDSIDWRTKNVVTAVKNQGGCGSCWAFSAIESVESHYAIANNKLLTLAPQAFVDCVQNPNECGGTGGCEGATMELAFNMTRDKGVPLETDLPYKGRDETCSSYKPAVKVTGYVKLPVNSADGLETALATKGPISVTVAAEPWMLYGGGTFTGCSRSSSGSGSELDHGVQAVGYTQDYWIVRNSWGPQWGDKGYILLSRSVDDKTFVDETPTDGTACKPYPKNQTIGGECGVLFDTSYPTGAAPASHDDTIVV